jgi:hypothetical protein
MVQPSLDFDAPAHDLYARDTLAKRVAALFRSRPGEWIDVTEFAAIAGIGGWRTRISDCRRYFGMPIEQRTFKWPDKRNRSRYMYTPAQPHTRPSGAQRSAA